jgi:hypothetical protein
MRSRHTISCCIKMHKISRLDSQFLIAKCVLCANGICASALKVHHAAGTTTGTSSGSSDSNDDGLKDHVLHQLHTCEWRLRFKASRSRQNVGSRRPVSKSSARLDDICRLLEQLLYSSSSSVLICFLVPVAVNDVPPVGCFLRVLRVATVGVDVGGDGDDAVDISSLVY